MENRARIESFEEFWPRYLAAHSAPETRTMHVLGTAAAFAFLMSLTVTGNLWFLLAAALSGYGFAWISHMMFERNSPETFRHPVWSLIADIRMFTLACFGRLDAELRHYKIDAIDG